MTSVIDLRTRRPVAVCAHRRARPYDATFIAKTQQLAEEVRFEQEFWREFVIDFEREVNDKVFQATGGLAL
ncbi:MAG TPA: hypothetical protein VFJ18_12105 [Pararhizobium sp.]|nr:hypothetical protein [Pararhizobium sp.]